MELTRYIIYYLKIKRATISFISMIKSKLRFLKKNPYKLEKETKQKNLVVFAFANTDILKKLSRSHNHKHKEHQNYKNNNGSQDKTEDEGFLFLKNRKHFFVKKKKKS